MGPERYRGLGQGTWMKKWLGPLLEACEGRRSLSACPLEQRQGLPWEEDPALPQHPARAPEPVTACAVNGAAGRDPSLGLAGFVASAYPLRAVPAFHFR